MYYPLFYVIISCQYIFGKSVGPIFSIYAGEQNHEGLKSGYQLANKAAIVDGIGVTLFLVLVAPLVSRFLSVEDPKRYRRVVTRVRLTTMSYNRSVFLVKPLGD